MHRVHVYYDRWPQLADVLREHADPDSPGHYAAMPKRRWLAIRDGKPVPSSAKAHTPPRQRKPRCKGPGDHLHDLIVARYGIAPCQQCLEVMEAMNQLGVAGCRRERQRLLEDMWARRENLTGWRAIAAKLPGAKGPALAELGRIFDEAVERACGCAKSE